MAFLAYVPDDQVAAGNRVPDRDNILRIHGVHPTAMRRHFDLYRDLMRGSGPLTRAQREMIALVVSATNGCRY